jgi:hypothetical protein
MNVFLDQGSDRPVFDPKLKYAAVYGVMKNHGVMENHAKCRGQHMPWVPATVAVPFAVWQFR